MKETYCGLDCCGVCEAHGTTCAGCLETNGHPCGGSCFAAELIRKDGIGAYLTLEEQIVDEINVLGLPGLQVTELYLMIGAYVNLEYPLPGGTSAKLLQDGQAYFTIQIERPGNERCYGVVADETLLLVCEYGCEGADPELLLYRKRR